MADAFLIGQGQRIAELASRYSLPSICEYREYVQTSGLMSYGPSLANSYRRAAAYVDKILKGVSTCPAPLDRAALAAVRLRTRSNLVGCSTVISELAHEARDQQQALLLAGRAHRIAIEAVSPEIFGHVFAADEGEED
jgi:hypothetical protein